MKRSPVFRHGGKGTKGEKKNYVTTYLEQKRRGFLNLEETASQEGRGAKNRGGGGGV